MQPLPPPPPPPTLNEILVCVSFPVVVVVQGRPKWLQPLENCPRKGNWKSVNFKGGGGGGGFMMVKDVVAMFHKHHLGGWGYA